MGWNVYVLTVLCLCVVALLAFAAGRRLGRRQGRTAALAEAPLRLRLSALREGKCPICNQGSGKWYNEPEEVVR
jgi:Tfp pilus assembly protein PilX